MVPFQSAAVIFDMMKKPKNDKVQEFWQVYGDIREVLFYALATRHHLTKALCFWAA